jgi:hypothetical protein
MEAVRACVVDLQTISWKTIEEAEAGVRSGLPEGWLYRLFFGWDDQRFGGIGVVKLVCFIPAGSGSGDVRESVRRTVGSEVPVHGPYQRKKAAGLPTFLKQELGILEGMAKLSGFASVGNLTTSLIEEQLSCSPMKLDPRCGVARMRYEWDEL